VTQRTLRPRLHRLVLEPVQRASWSALLASGILLGFAGCGGETDGASRPAKPSEVEGTTKNGVTPEQMKVWWALYQKADPKWPAARDRWSAAGQDARQTLILSLVRDLIQKGPQQTPDGKLAYRVPQADLLALPASDVSPVLIEMMRVSKDRSATDVLADTLAEIGDSEPVARALHDPRPGDAPLASTGFLRALVRIGGDRALAVVTQRMQQDPNWQNRSAAAEALRSARPADRQRAARAATLAFADGDAFVVRQGLRTIESLEDVSVAPDVARLLAQVSDEKEAETRKQAIATLRALTGKMVPGDDPSRWLEVAEDAAKSKR